MVWESFRCLFWQTPSGLASAFYWEVASVWPLYHKGLMVECCRDGCPSGRFSHLQRTSGALAVTIGFLVTSLTKDLLSRLLSLASSRKSLSGSELLPFKNDGGHCVLGDLQCCRNLLVPFPRSVPRHNPFSELYAQFLRPHGLVFALTCIANCGTLYRHVCAFPNHVQSIEFTTGGLQSSCWNISKMINENRMDLSSISSLIAKGLNTYVNKVFLFFYV